jgi:signal transduction histidine kinase
MILRRSFTDVALAAITALVVVWAVLGAAGDWRARVVLLALPLGVALVVARRWPLPAVGLSLTALIFTDGAGDDPQSAFLFALIVSCYVAGRYAPLAQLPWVGAGVLLMVSGTLLDTEPGGLGDAVFPVLFTAGPCLLGLSIQLGVRRERGVRDQAVLLDAMRGEEVRRASVEERLRIASDLHDLVAHDISAVSLQAQVARRGVQAGHPVDAETLLRIEQTAQQAMKDARRLLGLLKEYDDHGATPSPGLENLEELLARVRAIGQQVELQQSGPPRRLPPALSQAAYRIVQESLTNARRHGSGGTTLVHLRWARTSVDLRVVNYMGVGPDPVPGHGVAGITQRAEMFGGTAHIGALGDDWEVLVHLPVPDRVAT